MIKTATAIKFYCGLLLIFYITFPTCTLGALRDFSFENPNDNDSSSPQRSALGSKLKEQGEITPEKSDKSEPNKAPANQESEPEKETKEENSKESLFKDATYENFTPQDDTKIVDESYLEPRT